MYRNWWALHSGAMTGAGEQPVQCNDLVGIPSGELLMGSAMTFYPEEFPQSRVEVSAFQIGRGPVTNAQFADFCRASGHVTVAEQGADPGSLVFVGTPGPVALDEWRQWWRWVPGASWRAPEGPGTTVDERENHPVVHIAYSDALAYARWCGGDLPTEAEWEWAARGGLVGATYAWGEEPNRGERLYANTWQGDFPFDNHGAHGWRGTSPVGEFPPNGYGLADVTGNVWEWTRTVWAGSPGEGPCCSGAPAHDGDLKVIKGGSHLCSPQYCLRYRPAARSPQEIAASTSHIGFRICRR